MLCQHYMVRSAAAVTKVLDTETLGRALARMIKHHTQRQIVVDADDVFIGEVTTFTIAKLLMPAGDAQTREEAQLETIADVDDRITPHLGRRVGEFAERDVPVVHPDTPLSDALRMFASGTLRLPVVEPETKKLVGVISPLTVLRRYQF